MKLRGRERGGNLFPPHPPNMGIFFWGGSLYLFCSGSGKLGFSGEFRQRHFAKNQPQTGRGEPWSSRKQRIRFFIGRGTHIVRLPPRGSCRANARLREPAQLYFHACYIASADLSCRILLPSRFACHLPPGGRLQRKCLCRNIPINQNL